MYFVSGNNTVPLNVAIAANKQAQKQEKKVQNQSDKSSTSAPSFLNTLFTRASTPRKQTSATQSAPKESGNFEDFF